MKEIRIIIADDHPIFRKGLIEIIAADNEFQIIGDTGNGKSALEMILTLRPDIAILDINMPELNGLEILKNLHQHNTETLVIFLTMHKEDSLFHKALDLGARGYVLKESALEDILCCLREVGSGSMYVSSDLEESMNKRNNSDFRNEQESLTPAENTILQLIGEKKTSQEIADKLFISIRTVENHRANICRKLKIHGINALLKYALENKLNM